MVWMMVSSVDVKGARAADVSAGGRRARASLSEVIVGCGGVGVVVVVAKSCCIPETVVGERGGCIGIGGVVVLVVSALTSLGGVWSASAQGGGSSPEEVGRVLGGAASAQGQGTSPK